MKLRLEGTETECKQFIEMLRCIATLKRISRWYENRDNAAYGRVYIELEEG